MAINLESLMYRLLAESESNLFGPRDGRYTVRVVMEGVPNPSMRQSADTLTIVLTPECETRDRKSVV